MILFSLFVSGLIVWSLAEYLVHRFVLHWMYPRYHAIHHKDALDPTGDVGIVRGSLIAFVVLSLASVLGLSALAFTLGLLVGYCIYVCIHEDMHQLPSDLMPTLNRLHADHHKLWRYNYGITSPLWDWVFGTLKPK